MSRTRIKNGTKGPSAGRPSNALQLVDGGRGSPAEPPSEPEELNLRILQTLFRYVRKKHSDEMLQSIITRVGLPEEVLRRSAPWVSLAKTDAILAEIRELCGSDDEFLRACAWDIKNVYGPMALVLRCMTISTGYAAMARTIHLVSRVSRYSVVASGRNQIRLRYVTDLPESRLMCLSRQAQLRALPTVWGSTPARVEVFPSAVGGESSREYQIRWQEPLRVGWTLAGAVIGALMAALLGALTSVSSSALWISLPVAGLLVGVIIEFRRMFVDYQAFAETTSREVEQVVAAHGRAVDEILELHRREQQWNEHLESKHARRKQQLEEVVNEMRGLTDQQEDRLLSLSHDLNNPLTILSTALGHVQGTAAELTGDEVESLEAMDSAIGRLAELTGQVAEIAQGRDEVRLAAETLQVTEITDRVRRQLRATVVSRNIRVTVFQTREAPSEIHAPALVLERVLDNLLTNACKYTERGSIIVEVSGTPGTLLLKISDTGRGIGPERLEQVFLAGRPDPDPLIGESHGRGLAIVVRLLDQLGGRLEILSDPGQGTTFWVYVPIRSRDPALDFDDGAPGEPAPELRRFQRVVKIRPLQ